MNNCFHVKFDESFSINGANVISNTVEGWNAQPDLIAKKNVIYVYTDYDVDPEGRDVPGLKVGDGKTLLIDLAFIAGGGSGELEADLVVSNPIGRYGMDDVIPEGTGFESIFRGLLSKTYYPTLTDPSLAISWSVPSLAKVGANVASLQATLNFNRGSINPQYTAESPYRSGVAKDYAVSLVGASISYSDSGTSNVFTIPTFTRESPGNVILNASANYEAGVQPKDSDGSDYQSPLPAGSKSTSKTIEFILPFFYGINSSPTLTSLSGLTEDLSKKGNKNYSYTADNEYLFIAYDASYGNLKSILDENNFENLDSWVKSSITYEGQTYTVYRSGFAVTGNASFTFKF